MSTVTMAFNRYFPITDSANVQALSVDWMLRNSVLSVCRLPIAILLGAPKKMNVPCSKCAFLQVANPFNFIIKLNYITREKCIEK